MAQIIKIEEYKKRKNKEKSFDVVAFAKKKLLENDPKNSKYFDTGGK